MMLELSYGYPLEEPPVHVYYDGACFFFHQKKDDEKIVVSSDSIRKFISWLRCPERSIRFVIPGGNYRGIVKQMDISCLCKEEAWKTYPTITLEQNEESVSFDADEAPFLAGFLEGALFDDRIKSVSSPPPAETPVRPQDVVVRCPKCGKNNGKLIDCPLGQNEVRCPCGFTFSFRYTPEMTEGV